MKWVINTALKRRGYLYDVYMPWSERLVNSYSPSVLISAAKGTGFTELPGVGYASPNFQKLPMGLGIERKSSSTTIIRVIPLCLRLLATVQGVNNCHVVTELDLATAGRNLDLFHGIREADNVGH